MFPIRPRRISTALTAAACAVAFLGLSVADAAAGPKKKGRGHRKHDRVAVVHVIERPAPRPYFSWRFARPAPSWCSDASYVVLDGNPYWYHVGLGVFVGGVDVNVDIGNTPPRGYGYWDPQCNEWFDDVRAYSTHCKRHDHRAALRVVRWEDDDRLVCSCGYEHRRGHDDHDDHEYDWR